MERRERMVKLQQGVNPFLPFWEYVPDIEAHVFDERVYVYGSHDRFNGYSFCLNDYVCYSASIYDLTNWRFEGIIYKRTDDPKNSNGEMCLYAPDVTKGTDGRYYLYYVLDGLNIVSVAVCNTPAGHYEFYGNVKYPDGTLLGEEKDNQKQFDPAVLVEDAVVYLYTGSCSKSNRNNKGAMVTVLKEDMITVKSKPRIIVPSASYSENSSFENHSFFEASSIRKIDSKYYFLYSSIDMHELCYAVSDSPVGEFQYVGRIISNVDKGINYYKEKEFPIFSQIDNNHGSIEKINNKWYIFYHRHTNGHSFSRQSCLEEIEFQDGKILQKEITSSGPNGKPLKGRGFYNTYIACNLFGKEKAQSPEWPGERLGSKSPYITQERADNNELFSYVHNLVDHSIVGFKHFLFEQTVLTEIIVRGWCSGKFEILLEPFGIAIGEVHIEKSNEWKSYSINILLPEGKHSLYFKYKGKGSVSFLSFRFNE